MKKLKLFYLVLILNSIFCLGVFAQNITITDDDAYSADNSAMLDVKSTNKGMLIPRIDFNNKPASPATGLLIYVTANGPEGNNAFYYYNGTDWVKIAWEASETDPVYISSEAANITATDIANLGNLSGTNTGDQDLSTLALKSNVLELDNTAAFTPDADYEPATKKYVDDNAATTYTVGDFALGGIVFWVDETEQHGLVCAKVDQSTGVRWYAGTYGYTRANGDGPFSGEMNTAIIIASQVAIGDDGNTYAARICAELKITEGGKTYGDWYLPSKEELNLMYQNKTTIDATATANSGVAFTTIYYWSSTEYNNGYAWVQHFGNGVHYDYDKSDAGYVRAVRAF